MKKRKKYLIDAKFQLKLISTVVVLIIGAIIISGLVSYSITIYQEEKSNIQFYGTTPGGNINDMMEISSLFIVKPIVFKSLLIGGILSIIIASALMFFYSHCLAGPIYHIEKHLEKIIEGNYNEKLYFRKNDEFKQLSDIINKLQDKLKNKI